MKKTRNPKAKKPTPPPQPPRRQSTLPTKNKEPRRQILLAAFRTSWGKLVAGFALLGGLQAASTTIEFFKDAYDDTKPDIEISGDAKSPFSLPLTVNNKSSLFPMYDVDWNCGVEKIQSGSSTISGIGFKFETSPKYIKANGSALFPCNIINTATSANIIPIFKYKTFGISRRFDGKQFTWYGASDPPRWLASDRP